MDVYVLNRNFEMVDVCDDYKSIIWTTRYFENGDFELYLPATDNNISMMQKDFYLVRDKDITVKNDVVTYRNVMIIEKIRITTSIEDGNYLTVTGRCLKSILTRRIIWQQTILHGLVETSLRAVVNENAINPAITNRKISQLALADPKGFTDKMDRQVTGANLAEFIAEVCATYGIGWDIFIQDDSLKFELYKGENRSYSQTDNPFVVFSPEFDNLLTTDYSYDKTSYKNVALVAGEGEGLARKTTSVGDASDLDRYELYVDSRNSSSNDGNISEDDYTKMLAEEGTETLQDEANIVIENIEGQIETLSNYVFGEDYFLGDIVEVINEYGIETTPRIIEIIESEDENGTSTIPTFSTWEV